MTVNHFVASFYRRSSPCDVARGAADTKSNGNRCTDLAEAENVYFQEITVKVFL